MPAEDANREHSQEAFPFMSLPPELRVMIYKLALQDTVDAILSSASSSPDEPPPYLGALALLHASSIVRQESCESLLPIIWARCDNLLNDLRVILARHSELIKVEPVDWCVVEKMEHQYEQLDSQQRRLAAVRKTIVNVRMARVLANYDLAIARGRTSNRGL